MLLVGITDVVSYNACGICKSKVKEDSLEKCIKCGSDVRDSSDISFFFTLMIMNETDVYR